MLEKNVPDLSDLIDGCKRKEHRYEGLLYKTFYGYVFGLVLRYLRDREEVKELVNDSFVRIFRHIGYFSFDGPHEELAKAFRGWIARIAVNASLDSIRSTDRWKRMIELTGDVQQDIAFTPPDRLSFQDV